MEQVKEFFICVAGIVLYGGTGVVTILLIMPWIIKFMDWYTLWVKNF